jgi:hypothetical protein
MDPGAGVIAAAGNLSAAGHPTKANVRIPEPPTANGEEMKSSTIDQIHRHYSVRTYKPDTVPREMVKAVVAAGQRASTSSNLQVYSVVAVTEAGKRKRLAELCGNQKHIPQRRSFWRGAPI